MCLDLDKYGKPIKLFGDFDSDVNQYLDLKLRPCDEQDPNCRVGDFRDKVTGRMNTRALWDKLGIPSIEVFFRETRVDLEDHFEPLKAETTLNRSYLKKYIPTWGHNKVRINKFTDKSSIWFPLPYKKED